MYRLSAVAMLAALPLAAQTPNHLVGLTRNASALEQIDFANCQGISRCVPPGFPNGAALPAWAGGAAWDPTTRGAWITNGQVLARIDDGCTYQCPPMPLPFPGLNAVATGLEVVESLRQLFLIDSNGFLHQYSLTCPPQQIAMCQTGLSAAPFVPTGIAVDEGLRLVFISFSDFATNTNFIAVSPLAAPCQIMQRVPVQACPTSTGPFRAITGLGVDWCRRVIYATDGRTTAGMQYAPLAIGGIGIVNQTCCTLPAATPDPLVGLAVWPGRESSLGAACANGACPNCPMVLSLANDPNLGNGAFRLDLQGAPAGALSWLILGAGPCMPPGVLVPPLCGPLFLPVLLGNLGPVPTGGVGGCSGAAQYPLPLPVLPALCGAVISSQSVVLCLTSASLGTSMSHCVSFRLQGS